MYSYEWYVYLYITKKERKRNVNKTVEKEYNKA